jgi:hypothetical protein
MSETAETTAEQQPKAPSLGVQDLVTIAQIIQIATQRGSWKPEELSTVGLAYDKLIAFLDAAGAVAKPDDTATSEEQHAVALGE